MRNFPKNSKKIKEKVDKLLDEKPYEKFFNLKEAPSPLGDIRELIHQHGYGCFIETASCASFWHKISEMNERCIREQGDIEIYHVYAILAMLNDKEIDEWKIILDIEK